MGLNMSNNSNNTKRIFLNTIVLYVRMFITMMITLYSSRIVLQALGVEDYGIFNVVGGIVALLTFLKSSLASSSQRFISYELGRKDEDQLKKVFGTCVTSHLFMVLIILIIAESLGLWFLNAKMNIPEGRMIAANWVYQFAVGSLLLSMVSAPYNADIISHEKMTFFAVVGIVEAILKLLFALALLVFDTDCLILYAFLTFFLNFLVCFSYMIYCRLKFQEAKSVFYFEKEQFKCVFGFSGWTILGQSAVVAANYGTGILINMFHTVTANAAMGIAQQVNGALTGLTSNFQTAFQPQLTKSYAAEDYEYLNKLISYTSKISFFLLFIVTYPILLNINIVLNAWLTVVPEYTGTFCVLFIIASLLNALGTALWTSIFANGSIKSYQLTSSLIFFSDIIFVYIAFYCGCEPTACMVIKVIINLVILFVRLYFAQLKVTGFSASSYLKNSILTSFEATAITLLFTIPFFNVTESGIGVLLATIWSVIASMIIIYFVGLNKVEKAIVFNLITKLKNKYYGNH